MKWQAKVIPLIFSIVAMSVGAQSPTNDQVAPQVAQARAYWIDPSTKLMWAGRDNGKDVTWQEASKYCHNLRLAGYSGWGLASLSELQGIYDATINALGLARPGGPLTKDESSVATNSASQPTSALYVCVHLANSRKTVPENMTTV